MDRVFYQLFRPVQLRGGHGGHRAGGGASDRSAGAYRLHLVRLLRAWTAVQRVAGRPAEPQGAYRGGHAGVGGKQPADGAGRQRGADAGGVVPQRAVLRADLGADDPADDAVHAAGTAAQSDTVFPLRHVAGNHGHLSAHSPAGNSLPLAGIFSGAGGADAADGAGMDRRGGDHTGLLPNAGKGGNEKHRIWSPVCLCCWLSSCSWDCSRTAS